MKSLLIILAICSNIFPVLIKNISDPTVVSLVVICEDKANNLERSNFGVENEEIFTGALKVHISRGIDECMREGTDYYIGPRVIELRLLKGGKVYFVKKPRGCLDCSVM